VVPEQSLNILSAGDFATWPTEVARTAWRPLRVHTRQPSARTCAGSPNSRLEHHQRRSRALRERRVALKLRADRWYQSVTAAAPAGASGKGSQYQHSPPPPTNLLPDLIGRNPH
jgi:hypothetical protein